MIVYVLSVFNVSVQKTSAYQNNVLATRKKHERFDERFDQEANPNTPFI
jgi:hypothetical protein